VPIGAVLVLDGRAVARAHNRVEASGDPTAHAELLAIQQARSHSLVSSFRFIPRVMTPQRIWWLAVLGTRWALHGAGGL